MNINIAKIKANSINEAEYTIDFIMSAEVIDRHGEVVDLETLKVDKFLSLNPVVLTSHIQSAIQPVVVGKVLKIVFETIDGVKQMVGTVKFAVEEYDLAKTYWNLYKGGYQRSVSIGFMVGSVEVDGSGVTILRDCELIELSLVAIPANELAVAKRKGIDIEPILEQYPSHMLIKEIKDELITLKDMYEKSTEKITAPVTSPEVHKKHKIKSLLNNIIRNLK
jgi:hypothetical protein